MRAVLSRLSPQVEAGLVTASPPGLVIAAPGRLLTSPRYSSCQNTPHVHGSAREY